MKRNDYINIQAPMIADLHLKGNELLVFALIHGYTKDGKSKCRVSLNYIAKWLCTGKSAVIKVINTLEQAGYINRHEYLEGAVKCVEYTTNYEDLLERASMGEEISLSMVKNAAKIARGVKSTPASECTPEGGCQNDTGVKLTTKGCQVDNEKGVKMTPNNKYIIIYNNFSCAEPAQQEEEKKNFYKDFFFRNAADPAAEVERFIGYNDSCEWRNSEGRVYDTPEKRLGLAKLWKFQEGKWAREDYLKAITAIYKSATSQGIEGADVLVNQKVTIEWSGTLGKWIWSVTPDARRWIEGNSGLVHQFLDPMTQGKSVMWNMILNS